MVLIHASPADAHPIVILLGAQAWKVLLPTLAEGLSLLMARAFHCFLPAENA